MDAESEKCRSCGMPLYGASDHALDDEAIPYCPFCTNNDGTLKPFEEVRAGLATYLSHSKGLDSRTARHLAEITLFDMPAWQQQQGDKKK